MTNQPADTAATPGGEYVARYERAVVALRAICQPEHFDGAMAEASKRQRERGLGPIGAVESVYEDVALGWVPDV